PEAAGAVRTYGEMSSCPGNYPDLRRKSFPRGSGTAAHPWAYRWRMNTRATSALPGIILAGLLGAGVTVVLAFAEGASIAAKSREYDMGGIPILFAVIPVADHWMPGKSAWLLVALVVGFFVWIARRNRTSGTAPSV
ncbi:MAG: hypothetical protein ACT4PY_01625, partial [Armatimonadota bacterium]